jgi:putative FmdB family regulatory protein
MPLYEYECEAEQRHRFEVIQKFSDPPVETCPTCGSRVHKLISSPAFQFKGTGWYVTDYARKGGSDSRSSESPGTSTTTRSQDSSGSSSSAASSSSGSSDSPAKSD